LRGSVRQAPLAIRLAAVAVGATDVALRHFLGQSFHSDASPHGRAYLELLVAAMVELQNDRVGLPAIDAWVFEEVREEPLADAFPSDRRVSLRSCNDGGAVVLIVAFGAGALRRTISKGHDSGCQNGARFASRFSRKCARCASRRWISESRDGVMRGGGPGRSGRLASSSSRRPASIAARMPAVPPWTRRVTPLARSPRRRWRSRVSRAWGGRSTWRAARSGVVPMPPARRRGRPRPT